MMTNEESINGVMQTAMQGSRGAFFFLRWVFHHFAKTKFERPQREADRLMTDACSRYRGGYYHPENEALTEGLLSDLSSGKADPSAPFVFLGDRSDLSVFWQVTEPERRTLIRTVPDQRVAVPRKMLDEIPDEAIRQRVIAVFTKAQADGLLSFDGRSYCITESGKKYITRSDFVAKRLEDEYKFFTSAQTVLENEVSELKNVQKEDLINAELLKRGIDPEQYAGCHRISINRKSLHAEQNGKDWLTFVPGSAHKQKVILPSESVIELNERTLIAFIEPQKQYVGIGAKRQLSGNDLLKLFTDKTALQKRHPSVEAIRKTAQAELSAPKSASPAKLKVGETVFAPDHFSNSLKLNEYDVQGVLTDANGRNLYKLKGEEVPEQILPEEALDRFMFTDLSQGEAYLSAHSGEAADYADMLLAQTMGEKFTSAEPEEKIIYALTLDKQNLIANYGETCRIKLPGKQVEQMVLPGKDVVQQGEHLQITLHSDQSYKVITGAYSYSVSGEGLSKLSGATVQTTSIILDPVKQTVDETMNTAISSALPKIGDSLIAPLGSPFDANEIIATLQYRVVERLTNPTGEIFYKIAGGHSDVQIIPSSSINEYFFANQSKADTYLRTHKAHDKHDFEFLLGTENPEQLTIVEKEPSYSLMLNKDDIISNIGEIYKVRLSEAHGEIVSVPAQDVITEGGQLHITLHTDQFYPVQRGSLDFTEMSGHGVAQLTGKAASATAKTAASATVQTAITASAQTAVNTTVAAIPAPEPITATAKTLYAAAAQAAMSPAVQAASQTAQTSLKLTQSIGKEG